MIRKLDIKDNEKILALIKDEPEINLYIKSDLDNYGYDKDFLEYFGEFDEMGNLIAILVRFLNIFNVYAKGEYAVVEFAKIIKSFEDLNMISGKSSVVEKFDRTELQANTIEKYYFAVLREVDKNFKVDESIVVKRITIEDIDRIVELRNYVSEFPKGKNMKTLLEQEYKANTGKGFYVEVDGKMVSYAQSSAENSTAAMVVSVMTAEGYRGKGYASAIIKALCEDRINEGKNLCLYYKNPKAGEIYKRIGFRDIGLWSMYRY